MGILTVMSSSSTDTVQRGSAASEPAELRTKITHVRGELTDTLATLADKTDLPGRVADKSRQLKEQTVEKAKQARGQASGKAQHLARFAQRKAQQAPQVIQRKPGITAAVVAAVLVIVVVLVRALRSG